jgi:hypothetical protein
MQLSSSLSTKPVILILNVNFLTTARRYIHKFRTALYRRETTFSYFTLMFQLICLWHKFHVMGDAYLLSDVERVDIFKLMFTQLGIYLYTLESSNFITTTTYFIFIFNNCLVIIVTIRNN